MSRTIEIPDKVYAQLEQPAPKRGLTLPQRIAALVPEDESPHADCDCTSADTGRVPPANSTLPAPADFKPLQVQGIPLSGVLIEERR